ncbi:MAG: response regulator [Gammaproteobacteria bacterium]
MSSHTSEILIVDDSPTICATIAKYLGDEYTTHSAANGEEAWRLLQSNDAISLVFSDMHMPVMNGMMLLQSIRESDCERIANMPVIMITGHDDTEAAKKATHNLGATDFLGKPFDKIDILSRAKSYTRLNNKITELEKESVIDTRTGLYNNRMLIDFGNKTLSFGKRHNMVTSILYVEVADIDEFKQLYGEHAAETIVSTVAGQLEKSIRKEELASHIEEARFAAVLPNTKAFKAHIVATRIKQTVENLVFEINNITLRVKIAIGICSTEDSDKSGSMPFEQYCVLASHALATSLETPTKRITRYDETYEKKKSDELEAVASSPTTVNDAAEKAQANIAIPRPQLDGTGDNKETTDAIGDFFSCIFTGEYSKIPADFLPSLIEPLENFLEYAHATIDENNKISGE